MKRFLAVLALALPVAALAQPFPSRPATIVVGFAAGGAADLLARSAADHARELRGATVIVENRPGASGVIATERVAKSAPDGHTVSLGSPSPLWVLPQVQAVGYDPVKDLAYVAQLITQPLPLYVRSDSEFKTYKDVLAFARANPGKLRWGTSGARGFAEIVMGNAFRHEGVDTTTVPFKGGADAITALLGGHIEAVASSDFGPMLQAGRVRLLVETGPNRIPGQADVPTFKELGYPMAYPVFYGIFGPAGMPAEAVQWWEGVLKDLVASKRFAELASKMNGIPSYQGSAEFTQVVHRGHAEFGKALKSLPPVKR
jgi:tripartite-type tricarboxylate transporter receptor subunit TctC